jgi:IPT/TIG domain
MQASANQKRTVMRATINFALTLATLLLGLLLAPRAALADAYANCPTEPAANTPIALGETFSGSNCNLHTDGDVDSFVFSGTTGETYNVVAAVNGAKPVDMCLTLYSPSAVQIFRGCTSGNSFSVVADQKLTATGTYTVDLTELSTATLNYGLSLERLYPFPSDAQLVPKFGQSLAGALTPLTDSDAWTFPSATTGAYRVTATGLSTNSDLCMTVYFSNFTIAGSGCTSGSPKIIQIDFTPTTAEAGTNMAFLTVDGNDSTHNYDLEVSCEVGTCPLIPPPPPPCTLSDAASYNSTTSTLTMKFTVGNNLKAPAIWNAWLTYADLQGTDPDTMQLLFSKSQPITNPPTTSTETYRLPKEGQVGVLSTLSTPPGGIACYSWVRVNTGTEPPAISSFSPASGPVGTKVVITGQSLTGFTSVTFGGVKATSFTLNSDTQITVTVPSGAKTGKIVVTTPGGTATSAATFTVT